VISEFNGKDKIKKKPKLHLLCLFSLLAYFFPQLVQTDILLNRRMKKHFLRFRALSLREMPMTTL
jgi:hypothetical protein